MEEWIRKYFEEIAREMKRIREEMARFEAEMFKPLLDVERRSIEPLYEVHRYPDKIIIYVDLAGVKSKEDISLHVVENRLVLEAKLAKPSTLGYLTILRGEEFTHYRLEIELPENIVAERIRAKFRNGILEVTIPLETKRYRIEIE